MTRSSCGNQRMQLLNTDIVSTFLVFGSVVATCFVPCCLLFFFPPPFLLANLFRPRTFSEAFLGFLVVSSSPAFASHVARSVSIESSTVPRKMAFHSRAEVDFPIFTRTWPPSLSCSNWGSIIILARMACVLPTYGSSVHSTTTICSLRIGSITHCRTERATSSNSRSEIVHVLLVCACSQSCSVIMTSLCC